MSNLDFLSDGHSPAPEIAPVEDPTVHTELPVDQAAPIEITPEAAPAATDEEQSMVPYAALRAEREGRRAEAERIADLERQLAERPAPAPQVQQQYAPQDEAPLDPGFVLNREISEVRALVTHGPDAVKAAREWAFNQIEADRQAGRFSPLNAQLHNSNDPMEVVVREWQRDQLLNKVKPDQFDAFLAWQAQQQGAQQQPGGYQPAPVAAAPTQQPAPPRPSLAGAPSAGSVGSPIARDGASQYARIFGS